VKARPGATHIQIAAAGVKFVICYLELIFSIIGLGQGIAGFLKDSTHFIFFGSAPNSFIKNVSPA